MADQYIDQLVEETAPAVGDLALIEQADLSTENKITLANLLKVINVLTEDTAPNLAADFLMTYDVSATAVKKILLSRMAPLDGWTASPHTWVYVSGTSFKVTGTDVTEFYPKGTRIRWKDGGAYKYAVVAAATFSTDTTVTFTGGSDYSMANATITNNDHSYELSPQGFPDWFNWTASPAGWSVLTNNISSFKMLGKLVVAQMRFTGTSNATTKSATLPIAAAGSGATKGGSVAVVIQDNGGAFVFGWASITPGTSTVNFFTTPNSGVWTASGTSDIFRCMILYEA